jgi:two-component system LytT family response regulator
VRKPPTPKVRCWLTSCTRPPFSGYSNAWKTDLTLTDLEGYVPEVIFYDCLRWRLLRLLNSMPPLTKLNPSNKLQLPFRSRSEGWGGEFDRQKKQLTETKKILRFCRKTTRYLWKTEGNVVVRLGNVRLFESMGNYVRLYFDDQKLLVLKSLNVEW